MDSLSSITSLEAAKYLYRRFDGNTNRINAFLTNLVPQDLIDRINVAIRFLATENYALKSDKYDLLVGLGLFELMFEKLPVNNILEYAVGRRHRRIAVEAIARGATNFNWAATVATNLGYREILNDLVERGRARIDLNWIIRKAAENGQRDIVADLVRFGATDFDGAMRNAARVGHREIVIDLIERAPAAGARLDLNTALERAVEHGHRQIASDLIGRGATDLNSAFVKAASRGEREIVSDLIERARATGDQLDFDTAIMFAENNRERDTARYLRRARPRPRIG